jgi:hypothetical protein
MQSRKFANKLPEYERYRKVWSQLDRKKIAVSEAPNERKWLTIDNRGGRSG